MFSEYATMEEFVCNSCKKQLKGTQGVTRFLCPSCLKYEIIRCELCKKIVAKFKCANCGFEGPN